MTAETVTLPETQHAVQLVGPDELTLNTSKPVPTPGPYEILVKVEAVGLCFSDLKLLKQFDKHVRKTEIVGGIEPDVLKGIQSFVPGTLPTVPGHEVVCRVVAVGDQVQHHKVGERYLVQADYRQLPTAAGSNAAFGYNFEGGLQEYTLFDERVVIAPDGDRFLLPVGEEKSASAVALVEPWACVEDSYVTSERNTIKAGGRLLVVVADGREAKGVPESYSPDGEPAEVQNVLPTDVAALADEGYDDIVYFGSDKATIDGLNDKLTAGAIFNIVLGGERIGELVSVGVGRLHYGMTRWVGTTGDDAAESYKHIPADGEIRENDKILIVGAGGPMGQMHVIRNVCLGVPGVSVVGTDFDDPRIESLRAKAEPMAKANGVALRLVNPQNEPVDETFTYFALMAPVGALVADAIQKSDDDAIINIFAGIPAPTKHDLDVDDYIEKRCFMFGTSGSTIEDLRIVLKKVEGDQLDTDASVDAISGMAGATEGIAAVENRTMAGKIIVYPMLHDVGLIPLTELDKHFPTVIGKLENGKWNREAERELLRVAGGNG
ncbi:MAG: alcohol dehydrogenase catalytic domain-containing protein [Planctomycetes bacterium]|nr:alcohol dehydrogenase catalytic domain-containing protein [Planctomycetota bacterium]MBL7040726.1 alcohol dehydrogenase catalytic domain-containing protein [Pirellulaceae bacterium]